MGSPGSSLRGEAAAPIVTPFRCKGVDAPRLIDILGKFSVPTGVKAEEFAKAKLKMLRFALQRQVHFYFGDISYAKDAFLQSQADGDGWISLNFVAKFNRMRELTVDYELILECSRRCDIVEVSSCGL